SVPATGEGISVSTLSVDTSSNGSSTATSSPTCFSQRVTVPSVTDSPSSGRLTSVAMCVGPFLWLVRSGWGVGSRVRVERLPGQRQVGLAEGFVLGRVSVHQRGDVVGVRLPVVDQLCLTDELADPVADQMDAHHGTVLARDELDEALGHQDLALAVAPEVVG